MLKYHTSPKITSATNGIKVFKTLCKFFNSLKHSVLFCQKFSSDEFGHPVARESDLWPAKLFAMHSKTKLKNKVWKGLSTDKEKHTSSGSQGVGDKGEKKTGTPETVHII